MVVNNTIAAHIRQEKFNVSEIEDAIHTQSDYGSLSFELSFADLYTRRLIDIQTIKDNIPPERMEIVKSNIARMGGNM